MVVCVQIKCPNDCLLTVNLMKDDLPQYHVYVFLIQNIKDLLNSRNYSLQHSFREDNQYCANFMAKLGASIDEVLSIHSSPPEGLQPLLRIDELGSLFVRRQLPFCFLFFVSFCCFFDQPCKKKLNVQMTETRQVFSFFHILSLFNKTNIKC